MIQAYILISDNGNGDDLATFAVLPPWNKTVPLDFQQWNSRADTAAAFIRSVQEKAQQAGLPVVLDALLLDGLIGLFVDNGYEPVLVFRREGVWNIEVALQVCDSHGHGILNVVCARLWSEVDCAPKTREMAAMGYQAAVRNGIDFAADYDLTDYLPEDNDVVAPPGALVPSLSL